MNAKLVSNVVRCLCSVVFLVTCSTSARTEAASYEQTDGTIVDPILDTSGDSHSYRGSNLEPYTDLTNASLSRAVLADANLTSADLTRADLANADLANADLYRANLQYADLTQAGLRHADLYRVNLTGANLTWATLQHVVLLTFTGFHDPFSPAVVTNKQEEGPILTVIDACQVDRVFLISTSNTAEITQLTKEAIEEKKSDVVTEIITTSVDDPTDYFVILSELRRIYVDIISAVSDSNLFVSVTYGTPQMHACWLLLTTAGEIPARLLQS